VWGSGARFGRDIGCAQVSDGVNPPLFEFPNVQQPEGDPLAVAVQPEYESPRSGPPAPRIETSDASCETVERKRQLGLPVALVMTGVYEPPGGGKYPN
jgi:hypothetical protein